MRTLSIELTNDEFELLKKYSATKSMPMSEVLKQSFFEKLEDEFDIELFDKEYSNYLKNNKTYSLEEVISKLKI